MVISLAAAAFVLLGVASGATDLLDERLFLAAHRLDEKGLSALPGWAREAIRDVTALGSTVVLTFATAVVAAYLVAARRRRLAIVLVASAALATAASTVIKLLLDRARPSLIEHAVVTYSASFPSGHAMLTAAIILPMVALLARTIDRPAARRVIVASGLVLTVAVGLSRISLGVHWPTDVLAGWCIGAFWACATLLVARNDRRFE
ncbi:MAG: phosphatase PAP2 family protein, partial [Beijerinckiaceae bacterium]